MEGKPSARRLAMRMKETKRAGGFNSFRIEGVADVRLTMRRTLDNWWSETK